jgi:HEPN domain-containing protein
VETARKDWKAIKALFETKNYVHALFWSHLVLEKLIKAHWVKDNQENHPPKIHNLISLINKTKLQFKEEDMKFLSEMNHLQLEGRYPDYIKNVYKNYNAKTTKIILEQVNSVRKCLLKEL